MNLPELLQLKFPNIDFLKDVLLSDEGNGPFIREWNLEVPKPSKEDLELWADELKVPFALNKFKQDGIRLLQELIEAQAKSKNYDSSLSCASYANSQNLQWKAEADAFIAWRDAVWAYAYNLFEVAQQGGNIPSVDEVMQNLPQITWP